MCERVTIVSVANVGSDFEPDIGVWAQCNDRTATDCGFLVRHSITDEEGTEYYEPGDWWITSEEMDRYGEMHRAHTAKVA